MNLDEQVRDLIDNAPQDGTTPALVEAIAPVLKYLATQLRHPQYYVVQSLDKSWVVNIISHNTESNLERKVIYAFSTLKDVSLGPVSVKDPQMIALPVPVVHILFQMAAMEGVDSVIFFETPGNAMIGTEIQRSQLQELIQIQLYGQVNPAVEIRPDIA